MGNKSELAIYNHKNGHTCSGAIMCAFADEANMTSEQARKDSMPYAGGKMEKCGAVLAAEHILRKRFSGKEASEKIDELEARFMRMNSSVICRELKGLDTGKVLRNCRGCVTDAAVILEDLIGN